MFLGTKPSNWLGRTSATGPDLWCVGQKSTTHSIYQSSCQANTNSVKELKETQTTDIKTGKITTH